MIEMDAKRWRNLFTSVPPLQMAPFFGPVKSRTFPPRYVIDLHQYTKKRRRKVPGDSRLVGKP